MLTIAHLVLQLMQILFYDIPYIGNFLLQNFFAKMTLERGVNFSLSPIFAT